MVSSSSEKINAGIAIMTSTMRLKTWSTQPARAAARIPATPPIKNARQVVTKAMPTVLRAPYSNRVSMSRPRLSVPSMNGSPHSSNSAPTISDSP